MLPSSIGWFAMINVSQRQLNDMKNQVRLVAICLAALGAIGCSKQEDVSNNSIYGNFNAVTGTWTTKVELYLLRPQQSYERLLLISDAQYSNFNGQGLGVVPVGTQIEIRKLMKEENVSVTLYKAVGVLTSGPFSNREADLDRRLFINNALIGLSGPFPLGEHGWGVDVEKLERPSK
jgi:hypothetical protein